MWSAPLGMLAIEIGWIAAEVGRQPWIVQGELKTSDAASSVVPAGQILATLIIFVVIYAFLYAVWFRAMRKIIRNGPAGVATTSEAADAPAALMPAVDSQEVK